MRRRPRPHDPMFRSRFFWKLFLSHALVILLTLATIGLLVLQQYRSSLRGQLESGLRDQCIALADLSRPERVDGGLGGARERCDQVARATEHRVTLIRGDGVVILDTEAEAASMENHAGRPEVQAARAQGFGSDLRSSETVGVEYLYVAHAPFPDDPSACTVRLAMPTRLVDEEAGLITPLIFAGGAVAALLALVVSVYLVGRISLPLERIREVAAALTAGDYSARVALDQSSRGGDELGEMANALNRLGFDMRQRVADLTAGQERLRAMVAGMVEGVVAVDEDDRVIFSNHAARSLLGLPADAERLPLGDLVKVSGLDALMDGARLSDRSSQCELEMSTTDEDAIVRAQAHRFQNGAEMGVVVVLHDVSELRRLERIRRDFVANVSHELKTPLTSIRGYVETLLDGAIDDDEHNVRFLEKIENNVERLNHLVMDLLSLARIESQAGMLSRQSIDLHSIIEEAMRRYEATAEAREQALVLDACSGSVRILGDHEALTQILDNLFDNALKYTPDEGTVTVRVFRGATHATLEIEDDGVGIPEEDQARIFERFYRVDKARSRAVGGTGLGLSIVKHLVHAIQGTIELESEPGEGSTFRVQLELAEPAITSAD